MQIFALLLLAVGLDVSAGQPGPQGKEDVFQTFQWSLGDNGTVEISYKKSCKAFKPLEGMFLSINNAPDLNSKNVQFVPAPKAVVDSCAVSINLKAPVVLGEYDGSCISDPLFCTTGSFSWAVWLKIQPHNQQNVMGLANLISAGNYDRFKSGFNLWVFNGELLLCTANNNKERSVIGVNMTHILHEQNIHYGRWFHLACSFDFSDNGVFAMMYFNGRKVQQAENNPNPDWDGFLDMQDRYNLEDNHIDNYLRLGKYIPVYSSNGSGWPDDDFKVSYSNLMVTDGIIGPDTFEHLHLCGSMDWDLKLRSLVWVSKRDSPFTFQRVSEGVDPFTLHLVCTASASEGPSITWSVHKSKHEAWEDIRHEVDNGVRIENQKVSSCVLTSTLTVENYRKRGYTGSVVFCSTSTPGSGLHQSANVSVPGQPEYYQWALGEKDNVYLSSEEFCRSEVFNLGANGVMEVYGDTTLDMVPAPRVVEELCALRKRRHTWLITNNVNGTCVADQRYCTSAGFTWSVWLRFGNVINGHSIIHSGNFTDFGNYQDQMLTFNLWVTRDRLLFCSSAYNNVSTRGINITDASLNDKWFNIACVFNFSTTEDGNSGHAKAYINGIENKEQHEIDNLYFDEYKNYKYFSTVMQYGESYVSLGASYWHVVDRTDYSNLVVIDGVLEDAEIQHLHSCGSRNWDLKLRSLVRVSEGVNPLTLQLVCTASASKGPSITWSVYKSKRAVWDDVTGDEENGVRIENHDVSSCVLTSTLTITDYRKLIITGSVVMCEASKGGSPPYHSSNFTLPDQPKHYHWPLGDNGAVGAKSDELCSLASFSGGRVGVISNGTRYSPRMVLAPQVVEDSCAVSIGRYSYIDLGDLSSTCVADYNFCVSAGFTWSVWLKMDYNKFIGYRLNPIVGSGRGKRSNLDLWVTHDYKHLFCSAFINDSTIVRGIKLTDVNLINSWFHVACVFNFSSTVDTGVIRAYINAIENDGWYLDHVDNDHFAAQLDSLGHNLSLGHSFGILPHDSPVALSNLVVTDGPLGIKEIQNLYACGSLDWDLKLRSLVRVSQGVNPATLQLVCTASALTGPSITWSIYKSKRGVWADVTRDDVTGVRIENHDASSCVLTSTLTVENYRKLDYTGSVFVCSTSTPSSVSKMTANITIPDQPELYKWSLGDNGTVDLINGESCNTAVFTDGTVISYVDEVPTSLIPAPQVVEDSCAVRKSMYSYVDLGNYKGSCVSDYRFCVSTGYTWSVWLKVTSVRSVYRYPLSIISTGVGENSKFTFTLWLTRDLKFLVCTIDNQETNTNSSYNTPYPISRGVNVTSFVQDGECADCLWFHVACSVNFTDTEDEGRVETYINGAWINGSTDSFVDNLKLFDHEENVQFGDLTLGRDFKKYPSPLWYESEVAFSNLVLTDGFLGGVGIEHLYTCGSMEWGLNLRSLVRVSNGVSPFTLQLVCTASASTGPSITWGVYKSKRRVWEHVGDDEENGVRIENHDVSSCVLASTLTVMNYRKLGYSGSVLTCSTYCSSNEPKESATWTIEDQPELYQWSLSGNGTVDPNESCNTAAFVDDRVVPIYDVNERTASLITAPQVVDESCAILKPEYSYIDLGNFKDTCVSDYRFCMSTGYTWSVWLKIEILPTRNSYPCSVVSTGYDQNHKSNFRIWITEDSNFMVCSATKNKSSSSTVTKSSVSKGFNMTGLVREGICTDCPWFHVACAVNIDTDVIDMYVNGVLVDDEFYDDYDFEQITSLNLRLGNNLERVLFGLLEVRIAFSNLVLTDGNFGVEGVRNLLSCGSVDWSPRVRSLNEVTKGVDQSHLRLVCTASAADPGVDVAWRIYHSQCDVWETLQNGTDDRIVISRSIVSSCVQTSTLTILNYWDRFISSSIVMCSASIPDTSHNHTASLTFKNQALSVTGKSTSQSTTSGIFSPQNAIDGDRGSFSHTVVDDPHPWWKLDLGGEHRLGQITVRLRIGCCEGNLFIGATARAGLSSNYSVNQQCGQPANLSQSSPGATNVFMCFPPVLARWISFDIDPSYPGVTIAILQLAEVSVMEYTWKRNPETTPEEADSSVPLQEWSLKVQHLEQVSPFDQSHFKFQCKVSAIDDSFITWRVYRPRCKAWENLRNHTDAGIRIEEDKTSFCIQMSTLTILKYRERGYEGSAIFCSTATPHDDASDSAHLMILGNSGSTTEDWTLNADLINLTAATESSDVELQCTANAVSGPTIAWRVYRSKCGVWESLRKNETKEGVYIEHRSLSPCVELSIFTIMNYRERGYSGSVVECSTFTPGNDHVQVNFSISEIKTGEQIEDWTLHLHSLQRLIENVNQYDLQFSCVASASSGPSIAWHVYFPLCDVWNTLHNMTELGVMVEDRAASPCLKTSDLIISDYAERGYQGALIVCTAYATGKSANQSANLTIPDMKSDGPTEDWTLQLHSLERLTENINPYDLQLSCTASASSGPSIAWHVYFPLCDVWDTLHNMTELGVIVEDRDASPCMKTSDLIISDYAERGYQGALIVCTAYATGKSANQSANLTIPDIKSDGPTEDWTLKLHSLKRLTENINPHALQLSCTASASSGPSIAWHVYFPVCDVLDTLHNMTELGVMVEDRAESPCLKTSDLIISDYAKRGYQGAVIVCTAYATWKSANQSANLTIPDMKSDGPTEDWTLKLHSLERLTKNINEYDLQFSCTASASSGPSIAWHVYFPLCDVSDALHNMTELGVMVEDRAASPCLKTSTLTISEYAERGYQGAVIQCTLNATGLSKMFSEHIIPDHDYTAPLSDTHIVIQRQAVNNSNLQLLCTSYTTINPMIVWRVYQSRCGIWENFIISTKEGVALENRTLSSCVQTSTLTIFSYLQEGYSGAIIECSVTNTRNSANYSANFTISGVDEAKTESTKQGLVLTHVTEGLNQSDLRLLCKASTVSSIGGFRWQVFQPACRLQKPLLSLPEAGVHITELQVSPCVRSSTLEISDYRERGYGGSTILCKSTSAENNSMSYSANFTVQANVPNGETSPSGDNITHSNEGDLNILKQLEIADRDRDICGATIIYEEGGKVVTVFVLKTGKGEYTNIDTEFDNQVYSVKIPGIESSDNSLVTVISVFKSHGNFSGSKYSAGSSDKPLTFGSRIIEVTVFNGQGSKITDFSDAHVSLTFPVQGMPGYEPVCSFNSGKDNDWATEGCVVLNFNGYDDSSWNANGNGSVNITCSCDHLTHFAVLLRLGEDEQTFDTYVLDVLTKIGLALSIVCLAVTLMVYMILRLTSIRIVTHANLAFALMISDVIFFFIDTQNVVGCTLVAILLHFFLLAAFTWMALEGAFLYIKVTPTFPWRIRRPVWLLIGWGFPFGVVVISAAVNSGGYVGNGRCWLSFDDGFVWAFLAPVISIILVNTCILIRLVAIFFSLKANKDKSEAKKLKAGLRLAIVVEPLLGLPWVLGLFYTGKETVVFAYAFVILNSFQGVFVFLGQCVFDQEVKNSFKSRSSKVTSVSIPQDSTSLTLTSKQASTEPVSASFRGRMDKSF